MGASNAAQMTPISAARSIEEIGEYWDSHSLADHWDETEEAQFEVRAVRRRRVALDPDVFSQVAERARARGILPETLVNLWLQEHLQATP